jgi:hypothetical protein
MTGRSVTKFEPNSEAMTFAAGLACGWTAGWPAHARPRLATTIAVVSRHGGVGLGVNF